MKKYLYMTGAVLLIVAGSIGIVRANLPAAGGWCLRHGPGRFPLADQNERILVSVGADAGK